MVMSKSDKKGGRALGLAVDRWRRRDRRVPPDRTGNRQGIGGRRVGHSALGGDQA